MERPLVWVLSAHLMVLYSSKRIAFSPVVTKNKTNETKQNKKKKENSKKSITGTRPIQHFRALCDILAWGCLPLSSLCCSMVILTTMFFARGSYPLQLKVLCEGPIPSSRCTMATGFLQTRPIRPLSLTLSLGLLPFSCSCHTTINKYFDRNILHEGPIPSSQMFCARVLPPPVSV